MPDQTFSRFPPKRLFSCGNGGRMDRRSGAVGGEAAPRVPPSSRRRGFADAEGQAVRPGPGRV